MKTNRKSQCPACDRLVPIHETRLGSVYGSHVVRLGLSHLFHRWCPRAGMPVIPAPTPSREDLLAWSREAAAMLRRCRTILEDHPDNYHIGELGILDAILRARTWSEDAPESSTRKLLGSRFPVMKPMDAPGPDYKGFVDEIWEDGSEGWLRSSMLVHGLLTVVCINPEAHKNYHEKGCYRRVDAEGGRNERD